MSNESLVTTTELQPLNVSELKTTFNSNSTALTKQMKGLDKLSKSVPSEVKFTEVKEKTWKVFSHKVDGAEFNAVLKEVQTNAILQNDFTYKNITNISKLAKTIQKISDDSIKGIESSLITAYEAHNKAIKSLSALEITQGNLKEQQEKLSRAQKDIEDNFEITKKIVEKLKKFKEDIEKIKHISDVDFIHETLLETKALSDQCNNLINSANTQIDKLSSIIDDILKAQNDFNKKFETNENEHNEINDSLQTLSDNDKNLAEELTKMHDSFSDILSQTTDYINSLKNEVVKNFKAIEKKHSEYDKTLESLNETDTELKRDIEQLDAKTTQFIEELRNDNLSLRSKIKIFKILYAATSSISFILIALLACGVI